MNVLLVHNFYQQPGGEDQVFAAEGRLLEAHGHTVGRFTMDNDAVGGMGKLEVARKTIWNNDARKSLRKAIREAGAEVVHFHNTFPLVSPAGYYAAHEEGAVVVQTLHNFRLMCVNATFCRNGGVCEDCLGKMFAWPGILHACYRGNRAASAVAAAMQTFHRLKGTWRNEVDVYIALSDFGRKKFVEGGLPPEKILVKPNFLHPAPPVGKGEGDYIIFVGRLSEEKGIAPMLAAWPKIFAASGVKLKIVGDGPLRPAVETAVKNCNGIEFIGWLDLRKENYATIGSAKALIFPSIWYETQGMTIVESMAAGTPVIASRLGSRAEMIAEGRTGFLFESGNPDDIARAVRLFLSNETNIPQMRTAARAEFAARYTAEQNYPMLVKCYETALADR